MPQDVGWTLREAIRRTVDPDLLKQCVSAEREWRKAGAPKRFVRSFGLDHDDQSDEAARNRHRQDVRHGQQSAAKAVAEAFRSHLISGQMVARGRRGSPAAEVMTIPASAWKVLTFKDFGRSIVVEPNKTRIYDLRIIPALRSDDVVNRLHNEPLVKAFDFFVFNDPQVVSLRKRAIARGGHPRNIGFQSRLYQAYWYTDYGIPPEPDSMGSTIDEHELGKAARASDTVLRDRFRRIIQLLLDGAIVAEGVPARDGVPVQIPRAMWFRKGGVLDLYKGDYFEQYPDPTVPEDQLQPLYLSLMLQRASGSAEKLHVKPTAYDQVPSRTISHEEAASPQAGKSKATEAVKTRQQVWRECCVWLEEEMRKSLSHKPFPKTYWRSEAKAKWSGVLSHRAFDDAWEEAVKNSGAIAWAAAGAPKRSRQ